MKNQMRLTALLVCAVSLSVGCARTNAPAKKGDTNPTPVTAPEAGADKATGQPEAATADAEVPTTAPATTELRPTPAGSIAVTAAGSLSTTQAPAQDPATQAPGDQGGDQAGEPLAAGSVSGEALAAGSISAGSMSAGSLSAGSVTTAAATDVQEIVVIASISPQSALAYIERLKLPLVLPFAMPKHDAKEEVKSFVGIGCDKEIAASRKVKSASNLVSKLTKDLCFTNVLRQGKTTLVVVPKKSISRTTVITNLLSSVTRKYEVVLRKDSSVAAVRETITTKDRKNTNVVTRITMVNAKGVVLTSAVDSKSSTLMADAGNGAIVYESKSVLGNAKVASAKKSLVVKNYENKGLSLTVNEDSPTTNPEDISCNLIAVRKDLEVLMSKTIKGRCFHRN